MAKVYSDHLFQLIKTMSKSEKRYFRLYSSRLQSSEDKKFLLLFDLIEKQTNYDEAKILKKTRIINPVQLPNLKAHLYKQLMHSLKLFTASSSIDVQLRNHIDYTQLLYNKGLYDQAIKMLDKAKKQAIEYDKSIILLDIIDLEKSIISHTISAKNDSRVNKIIEETKQVSSRIENINIFSNLLLKLNSFYVKIGFIRDGKDFKQVQEFFNSSLPPYNEKNLSFQEKLYLYNSFISYYFFIQDFEKGYKYAIKYIQLFDENPEMIIHKSEFYIKGINHLLVVTHKLYLFNEFEANYKLLMKVHNIKGLVLTENLQMMLFRYKYMHKINHYYMIGDFTGGSKIISVVENELDRFALRMDKHDVLVFYYKVACLYFGASNFKKALIWLNKIINSKDVDLREDILSFARILSLICHFELKNIELVEYHIKSTYRFLLKKQGLYKYFIYIIDFMKNLDKNMQGKKLIRHFEDLKEKLTKLENQKYERRPFLYFDIISWLESRIENKAVEDIIHTKAMRRIKNK